VGATKRDRKRRGARKSTFHSPELPRLRASGLLSRSLPLTVSSASAPS
jgi:hypothetical protein